MFVTAFGTRGHTNKNYQNYQEHRSVMERKRMKHLASLGICMDSPKYISRPAHGGLGCWTSLMALRGDGEVGDCVYTLHASLLPTP